jgi:hypothetical protein
MTDRIEELEARLAEVTAKLHKWMGIWSQEHYRVIAGNLRAEAAEARLAKVTKEREEHYWMSEARLLLCEIEKAANQRFYRAGIEAARDHLVSTIASHKALGQHGTYPTIRESSLEAIRALPDPTDEQQDAIRKGGE